MVQVHLGPFKVKALIKGNDGGLAQMGERLLCTQEVIGSIPLASIETVVSQGLVH
jgi:hypothetical protein